MDNESWDIFLDQYKLLLENRDSWKDLCKEIFNEFSQHTEDDETRTLFLRDMGHIDEEKLEEYEF